MPGHTLRSVTRESDSGVASAFRQKPNPIMLTMTIPVHGVRLPTFLRRAFNAQRAFIAQTSFMVAGVVSCSPTWPSPR
jgi:hypothetical protein